MIFGRLTATEQAEIDELRSNREKDLRKARGRINALIIFVIVPGAAALVYSGVEVADVLIFLASLLVAYWFIYGLAYAAVLPILVCVKLTQIYSCKIYRALKFGVRSTSSAIGTRFKSLSLSVHRSGNAT